MNSLDEIIHDIALQNNPKAIAEELNKPYSTFMREINPHDEGAKFGAASLIPFTRATGDFGAIDYIDAALGRIAFELPRKRPGLRRVHRDLSSSIKEFGELVKAVGDSLDDGKITRAECERCQKEGYELMQAVALLIYSLEGQHENSER